MKTEAEIGVMSVASRCSLQPSEGAWPCSQLGVGLWPSKI